MKIAWHSICYVDLCEDPERVFGDAQEAGYDGIELMQSFESLGGIDKVAKLCEKYKMPIVCSWGGEIRSRIREGHAVGLQFVPVGGTPQYIAELAAYAKPYGVRLVLHPHIGGQGRGSGEVETYTDCENYLAARPDLWLCPDTAHLTVAGSDPAQVILDMSSKLVYVHLKDWRYSKSYGKGGRYGLGFCELGTGMVNLSGALTALQIVGYEREDDWLCVEQDVVPRKPVESAKHSRDFLRDWGI